MQGSNPPLHPRLFFAPVIQSEECLSSKEDVTGSSPVGSTINIQHGTKGSTFSYIKEKVMPSGKVHDKTTILFSPLVIGGAIWFDLDTHQIVTLVSLYFFSGFMFNGDLDVISRPYNRWGLLKFIWKPYQSIFSHRSIWTHGLIIGTMVRLLYLSMIIIPVLYYLDINPIEYLYSKDFLIIFLGLESGAALHTTLDYTI